MSADLETRVGEIERLLALVPDVIRIRAEERAAAERDERAQSVAAGPAAVAALSPDQRRAVLADLDILSAVALIERAGDDDREALLEVARYSVVVLARAVRDGEVPRNVVVRSHTYTDVVEFISIAGARRLEDAGYGARVLCEAGTEAARRRAGLPIELDPGSGKYYRRRALRDLENGLHIPEHELAALLEVSATLRAAAESGEIVVEHCSDDFDRKLYAARQGWK